MDRALYPKAMVSRARAVECNGRMGVVLAISAALLRYISKVVPSSHK